MQLLPPTVTLLCPAQLPNCNNINSGLSPTPSSLLSTFSDYTKWAKILSIFFFFFLLPPLSLRSLIPFLLSSLLCFQGLLVPFWHKICYLVKDNLELLIFLPLPPEFGEYRYVPPSFISCGCMKWILWFIPIRQIVYRMSCIPSLIFCFSFPHLLPVI